MLNIPDSFRVVIYVVGILILAWLTLNFKRLFFRKIKKNRLQGKRTLDPSTAHIVNKALSILIFFVALMLILQILGMDIVPLLTVSGIGAAILGFASKDMVANFFGGVMIYITRPFSVDDQIEIPSKSVLGFVEEIGWYHTEVRSLQKKLLYIPNSIFFTEILWNYSRMTHRRIEEHVRIRIKDESRTPAIIEAVKKYISEHPGIDHRELIVVVVSSMSPWGIVLEVKACTRSTKYLDFSLVKQDVLLEIHKIAYEMNF